MGNQLNEKGIGVGMLGLSMCFFKLSVVKTDLTNGIYSYAREGFGEYVGFNSAWGYWMSALLAQLSFITLLFAALGNFFSIFGTGSFQEEERIQRLREKRH